VDDRCL